MNKIDLQRLKNAAFINSNSQIMCVFNVLTHSYHKLSEMQRVLKLQGIDEASFVESINFLARAGYIELRDITSQVNANLADWDYKNLEGILTDKGIRLMAGDMKDNLIEV